MTHTRLADIPARRVVTARLAVTLVPGRPPVADAAVALDGRRILAVGPRRRVLADWPWPVVDLGDAVVVPGLVNAHVHLELSHLRGLSPRGAGFTTWVSWLLTQPLFPTPPDALRLAVAEMAAAGIGGVMDIGSRSSPAVAAALGEAGLSGWVCHEYFGFGRPPAAEVPPGLDAAVREAPPLAATASGHALYSTSPQRLRRAREVCRRRGAPFSLHLAEHAGETELLAAGTGTFADMLRGRVLPRDWRPPGLSPVAAAEAWGLLGPETLAVHAVCLEPGDVARLAASGAAVCLCPRSNARIGVGLADAPALAAAGVPLCLGTDSLASNDDLDLWNEVRALLAAHPDFPPEAVLPALTVVPAGILGRAGDLGRLAPGMAGGLAVLPPDLEALAGIR